MPQQFRAATFNIENLFERAKVINMGDHAKAERILNDVGSLNKLLGKAAYSAADKAAILQFAEALKNYITIREDRGKLFTGSGANRRVSASGAKDWDGAIAFKRAPISEMARESTADVVKAVRAEVLCTVEIENRPTLQNFNRECLDTKKFKYAMAIDGNDERGIDVGLLSQFELVNIRSHVYDRDSVGIIFSRDCLEVELRLPDGRSLHVLCNHLKSKGYGAQAANDAKRKRQATQLARILSRYNLASELVIVAGDMNDEPASTPLRPLVNTPNLFDVLELQFGNDAMKRWTYRYRNQKSQIDFLLVSKPLKTGFQSAGVERRGLHGIKSITGETPFPSVKSPSTAASDHGAVWAEFRV